MKNDRLKIVKAVLSALNIIRLFIVNCLFYGLLIVIFTSLFFATSKKIAKEPSVLADSVLLIQPVGAILETEINTTFADKFFSQDKYYTQLSKIVKSISNACYDRRIKAIVFDFSKIDYMSLSSAYEIKKVIDEFVETDKPYYAFDRFYNLASYFLASSANRICIDPFGDADFSGFATEGLFLGGMPEKTGINYTVSKAGTYKGAADSYTEKAFTDSVRQNYETLLSEYWSYFVSSCAKGRCIEENIIRNYVEDFLQILEKAKGDVPTALLQSNLITDIQEFSSFLDNSLELKDANIISLDEFYKTVEIPQSKNAIYIVELKGAITSNPNDSYYDTMANDWKIIDRLNKACDDPEVRGIVLRIDSGGGEVIASEEIRRAIEYIRNEYNIPIVVSMADVAASGAYWIASSADAIFANPFTLTGSIGVLAAIPNVEKAFEKYLGISSDLVYKGAKPYSIFQTPSDTDIKIMQLQILNTYDKFLQTVSNGRKMEKDKVASIASGMVYSGEKAKTLGLVDKIGSLKDAIFYTAELCDIANDYKVTTILDEKSFMQKLIEIASQAKLPASKIDNLKMLLELSELESKNKPLLYESFKLLTK